VSETPAWAAQSAATPDLAPLWDEYHRRASERGDPTAVKSVTLTGLTGAQATAVANLLRLPKTPDGRVTVRLDKVAAAWRTDADGVADLLVRLRGPVTNRAAERDARRQHRQDAATRLAEHATACGHPDTVASWAASRARGTDADDTIAAVLDLAAAADPARPVAITVVAATRFGDAHALDPDQPAGRLFTRLVALLHDRDPDTLASAERRRLLRAIGLADDDVSSTVAVWNLPLPDGHPAAGLAAACTRDRIPFALTLGQLRQWPPAPAPVRILVVENPSVLSAAAERTHPDVVVCTSGVPNAAVHELLTALAGPATRMDVHADYDEVGLRIVAELAAAYGANPWKMDAPTYETAAAASSVPLPDGAAPDSPWDGQLAIAMKRIGRAAYEEHVIDKVLSGWG
jgi:uncharacterized protein (TIGR02679 family)